MSKLARPLIIGTIIALFVIQFGCSGRPLFWNTFYKGDREDIYKSKFLVASANGDFEYVQKHIKEHPKPDNDRGEWGSTALSLATWGRHHEIMRLLLEAGANPDESVHGGTPLSIAIFLGDTIGFDLLMARANLVLRSKDGWSALHQACSYINPHAGEVDHMVLALLKAGLDPNSPYPNGDLPLIQLTRHQRERAIITMLERGGDPQKLDQAGNSAVAEAEKQISAAKQYLAHNQQLLSEFDAGKKNIWSREDLLNYISTDQKKVECALRILSALNRVRGGSSVSPSTQQPPRT